MELKRWIRAEPHEASLLELAKGADHIVVNAAFLSDAGVDLVTKLLAVASVDLVTSLYLRVTRASALKGCRKLLAETGKHALRVGVLPADIEFHGKVVAFKKGTSGTVVIGSANWTKQGLTGAGEASAVLAGTWKDAAGALTAPKKWSTKANTEALDAVIASYTEAAWPAALLSGAEEGLVLMGVWQAKGMSAEIIEAHTPTELKAADDVSSFLARRRDGASRLTAVTATQVGDPVVLVNSKSADAWRGEDEDERGKAEIGTVVAVIPVGPASDADVLLLYRCEVGDLDGDEVRAALGPNSRRIAASRILDLKP